MTRTLDVRVPVRWSDMDAFNHINNVQIARIMEDTRIRAFWKRENVQPESETYPTAIINAGPTGSTWTLIARQEIEYLQPMPYFFDPIVVEIWFSKLGGASIEICYRLFDPTKENLYSIGKTTLVLVDAKTQKPRRIRPEEREVWEQYLNDPIEFRRN